MEFYRLNCLSGLWYEFRGRPENLMKHPICCASSILFSLALCLLLPSAHANLPARSQELVNKLEEFEKAEEAAFREKVQEKREAVIKLLKEHAVVETKRGDLDAALSISTAIIGLGGKSDSIEAAPGAAAPEWKIPDDATRYKGDYYKVYPLNEAITWDEARVQCQALGGELGWIDREEDDEFLRKIMQPAVDAKGHAPIWIGGKKNEAGVWEWLSGKEVEAGFWANQSDAVSAADVSVMVRWIGSFKASRPDSDRIIGYLCRWKR